MDTAFRLGWLSVGALLCAVAIAGCDSDDEGDSGSSSGSSSSGSSSSSGGSCDAAYCSGHGTCADSGGQPICTCDAGYAGTVCDICAGGYQDNDDDGSCLPDCETAGLSCGSHGDCVDTSGAANCVCDPGWSGDACDSCSAADTPAETFDAIDAPTSVAVTGSTFSVSTPWGYDKPENMQRSYPLVVHGCWGEGYLVSDDVKQEYPSFYLTYQKCDYDSEGADLSVLIDAAVGQGLRIDVNRIYLTGWSKGGSGSYKLVRGFLSEGKLFAGIVRIAGQSETVLPDEAVEKTSIWYHVGLQDTAERVQVARDAYDFVKDHGLNASAGETTDDDVVTVDSTTYNRTTAILTKDGIAVMKLSEYEGMGHVPEPPYADPGLFDWLFSQSLECR